MTKPLTLTLPWPISTNDYWSSRVVKSKQTGKNIVLTFVTDRARAYKEAVLWEVRKVGRFDPFPWRVSVHIELIPARPLDWAKRAQKNPMGWDDDVRCMDIDNARKVLYDALKGVLFVDDRWVWSDSAKRLEPDGGPARVVVTITPIERPEGPQGELLPMAADNGAF